MKRTDFIKLSGFGFSSLLLTNKRGFAAEKKPNIVFIFSDDHAVNSISAYSGKLNKTPNIDRIAKQGARGVDLFLCGAHRGALSHRD